MSGEVRGSVGDIERAEVAANDDLRSRREIVGAPERVGALHRRAALGAGDVCFEGGCVAADRDGIKTSVAQVDGVGPFAIGLEEDGADDVFHDSDAGVLEGVPTERVGRADGDVAEHIVGGDVAAYGNAAGALAGHFDIDRVDSAGAVAGGPGIKLGVGDAVGDRLDVDGADALFGREVGGVDAASAGGHGDIAHGRGVGQLGGAGDRIRGKIGVLHCSALAREGHIDVADAARSTCQEVAVLHGVVIARVV